MALRRRVAFSTLEEKAQWLDSAASLDANLTAVRHLAGRFARAAGANQWGQLARDLHRFVRDSIRYVHDPGSEEFADSAVILARGYEDCDGKARLFVALCRSCGIDARIRPVFKKHPIDFVHVQCEVRWPGSALESSSTADGWMLAEIILHGCEIGQDPDTCPRGPGGKRLLA
jgi:transglutaminase-like putative cysteine protease